MDTQTLRNRIADALELGEPVLRDGLPLTRFEMLFALDGAAPRLGLAYHESMQTIVALPLAEAYASLFFVPFDFDEICEDDPRVCTKRMMLDMASLLRESRLPTLDEAIIDWSMSSVSRSPEHHLND